MPNHLDDDADGDGVLDEDEAGPDPFNPQTTGSSGEPDFLNPLVPGAGANVYLPGIQK